MHSEVTTPILHGDVKPVNILLDDDFVPKISDFSASRMLTSDKRHAELPIGQPGYIDPAHHVGELTSESDVYSFAIVLLELITRKKPSHHDISSLRLSSDDTGTKINTVVQLVDPDIKGDIKLFRSLAKIILQCLNPSIDQRPKMADIAERLKYLAKRCRANRNKMGHLSNVFQHSISYVSEYKLNKESRSEFSLCVIEAYLDFACYSAICFISLNCSYIFT
ncbi:hypothetical protein PR202_gb06594 [Eleusine coracana subsp. coracana]|uniref:Protein kinase domain-containing protein n=1 Tax=Eleusine coracana subsp. coracana TaxID=191504 RepID=A0AAV5EAB2_ELECO|nr:hypothetical protein PR202_gb06594 [Eleusine coracana subsp. coracana]